MNMVEGMCNPVPEMKHGGGNHLEGTNYDLSSYQNKGETEYTVTGDVELPAYKKGGPGLWANVHAKRKRGESPAKKGDKDYPDSKQWNKLTKAMDGTEMDTDEVADKYDLQTVGLDEGDREWQTPPTSYKVW